MFLRRLVCQLICSRLRDCPNILKFGREEIVEIAEIFFLTAQVTLGTIISFVVCICCVFHFLDLQPKNRYQSQTTALRMNAT